MAKKKRNVGRWIGVKIGGGRCSMTMSPGTRGTVGAAPSPPYCAAGLFGDQACISAGSSSTQHHFSCGRSARISVTERRCRGEGEQGCTHSIHPTCPTALPLCHGSPAPLRRWGLIRKMDMKVELGSVFSLIQNIQKLLTVVGVKKQLVLISCSSNCVSFFFFSCFSRAL